MQGGSSPKQQSAGIKEIREIASASSATASTNAPPKQSNTDDARTGQDYDHNKIDFGGWRRSVIGEASGSSPKSESSDGNANRVGGGDKFSRYRVCMEGGVPILQEAKAHEGEGEVYDVGDDGQAATAAAAATGGGPGKNVSCNPFDGGKNRERARNSSGCSDSGSPEIASHGMLMGMKVEGANRGAGTRGGEAGNGKGMGREAKVGGAGVVTSSGLVEPMTEAEIAGGVMFGFGNDLRVSI